MTEILKSANKLDDKSTNILDKKFAEQQETLASLTSRREILKNLQIDVDSKYGHALAKMLDDINATLCEIVDPETGIVSEEQNFLIEDNIILLAAHRKRDHVFNTVKVA